MYYGKGFWVCFVSYKIRTKQNYLLLLMQCISQAENREAEESL